MPLIKDPDDDLKPAAMPPPDGMSNQDLLGMALVALAPTLLGGAMGGKKGAMAGSAAGLGAVGSTLQKEVDAETKAKADEKARTKERTEFESREIFKSNLKPEPDPKTRAITRTVGDKEVTEIVEDTPGQKFEGDVKKPKPEKDTSKADPKELRNAAMQARNKFTAEARPYTTAMNSAKDTEKLASMAKTNPRAAGALLGKLARAAGEVGVLSDADIERLGGATSFQERLERFTLKSTTDQKITEDDIRSATELAQVMQARAQENLSNLTKTQVESFVAIYGGTPEEAYKKITGMDAPKAAPNTKAPVSVDDMDEAEVDAQLRARGLLK